ncbi:MAG: PUR family DNA/RNA-binding protein [Bacteroidia bacterium]|nr:PUR family DNA/RNA-binding protein [Bacteroidia bacterium]
MQGRDEVYSEKIRAGKRTYFFDVRETRSNDFYITITESKRKFNSPGYDKHKIFLYKEDFNKFLSSLEKTIDFVKAELMPDYDYDEFDRQHDDYADDEYEGSYLAEARYAEEDEPADSEKTESLSTRWED